MSACVISQSPRYREHLRAIPLGCVWVWSCEAPANQNRAGDGSKKEPWANELLLLPAWRLSVCEFGLSHGFGRCLPSYDPWFCSTNPLLGSAAEYQGPVRYRGKGGYVGQSVTQCHGELEGYSINVAIINHSTKDTASHSLSVQRCVLRAAASLSEFFFSDFLSSYFNFWVTGCLFPF